MIKYSPTTGGFYLDSLHDEIPADAVEVQEAAYQALMAGNATGRNIVPGDRGIPELAAVAAPSADERRRALAAAVQQHLDAAARALGYDDMRSAVTYADESAVPKFQAEGQALRAWRSLVWAACYEELAQWQAGEIQEPSATDLIGSLPEFVAPA